MNTIEREKRNQLAESSLARGLIADACNTLLDAAGILGPKHGGESLKHQVVELLAFSEFLQGIEEALKGELSHGN